LTKFKLCGVPQIKSTTCETQYGHCWEPSEVVHAKAQLSSAQGERFNVLRNQSFSRKKATTIAPKALTVRLLWKVWIAVEKAQKSLPTAPQPS